MRFANIPPHLRRANRKRKVIRWFPAQFCNSSYSTCVMDSVYPIIYMYMLIHILYLYNKYIHLYCIDYWNYVLYCINLFVRIGLVVVILRM
jgi:hypothetical protein